MHSQQTTEDAAAIEQYKQEMDAYAAMEYEVYVVCDRELHELEIAELATSCGSPSCYGSGSGGDLWFRFPSEWQARRFMREAQSRSDCQIESISIHCF